MYCYIDTYCRDKNRLKLIPCSIVKFRETVKNFTSKLVKYYSNKRKDNEYYDIDIFNKLLKFYNELYYKSPKLKQIKNQDNIQQYDIIGNINNEDILFCTLNGIEYKPIIEKSDDIKIPKAKTTMTGKITKEGSFQHSLKHWTNKDSNISNDDTEYLIEVHDRWVIKIL